jgi:hypothetical protein
LFILAFKLIFDLIPGSEVSSAAGILFQTRT